MRNLMIIISIIAGITVKAQSFDLLESGFKGNIKRIIEKSEKFPDSWREYNFDSRYRLQEKNYYRNYKLVQTETTSYFGNDSLLTTRKVINSEIYTDRYYFNPDKRLKRHEVFSSIDSIVPMAIFTDFIYESNKLREYNRIIIVKSDTTLIEHSQIKYNKNKLLVTTTENNKFGKSISFSVFKYDKKGNLISKTVDHNNPHVVLGGVRTWSPFRHDKYRIDYKLDKYGNWISRYSVTWLRKRKIEERQIEYK
jgi:hypothetical protein